MKPRDKAKEIILNYESIIALNSWCDENTTEKEINRLIKLCALKSVEQIMELELTSKEMFYWGDVFRVLKYDKL
jgi:methionine aminopeptidase